MSFITNPVSSKSNCYILTEKELIVCSNGSLPSFEDTLMLRKLSPDSDFFDEKETGICAMEFEISENAVLPQGFEKNFCVNILRKMMSLQVLWRQGPGQFLRGGTKQSSAANVAENLRTVINFLPGNVMPAKKIIFHA